MVPSMAPPQAEHSTNSTGSSGGTPQQQHHHRHPCPGYPSRAELWTLPPDALLTIASLLPPRALSRAARTCKALLTILSSDSAWAELAVRRWGLQSGRPARCYGGVTWRAAYMNLAYSLRLPRGQFSHKHSFVFARGRGDGVDAWCSFAHNHGCRPRAVTCADGSESLAFELRVFVQNVHNNSAYVDMSQMRVVCKPGAAAGGPAPAAAAAAMARTASASAFAAYACSLDSLHTISAEGFPHVAALNGASSTCPAVAPATASQLLGSSTMSTVVVLRPLGFAVLSVLVSAAGCEFETDFIARGLCLHMPVVTVPDAPAPAHSAPTSTSSTSTSTSTPPPPRRWDADACALCPCIARAAEKGAEAVRRRRRRGAVRAPFMDEARITEHYDHLPGGCLVLRERRLDGL